MSAMSVEVPFPVFQDQNGQPLENGYVWVGIANMHPQTNPVQVYFDRDLTVIADQPLRTINGYISRSGSPAQVYVDGNNFSIFVQDFQGNTVYNFADATGIAPLPNNICSTTYQAPYPQSVSMPTCEKLGQSISVKDFGAVGNGVTDDTAAIQSAQATGKLLWVPASANSYYLPAPVTNTTAAYFPEPTLSWVNFTSNGNLKWTRGFSTDGVNGANVWRLKDRVMVGDAADYSGNRLGANNYGNAWVINKGANYLVKNATMAVAAPELDEIGVRRYGIIGFSKSMGVGAIAVNDGANTSARGLYAEGFHKTTVAGATVGVEIQMGNYTNRFPVAHAYNMANVEASGLFIGAESGVGYTVGNNDTPITPATQPCGAAIDISGGSINASYQKWVTGIVFRTGGLYRDPVTGLATAISLARQHEIVWGLGTSEPRVAFIRSDVASALTPIGIILKNNTVDIVGANGQKVVELVDIRAGTVDAVNYLRLFNSATNTALQVVAAGTDTDIDLQLTPKGAGKVRFGVYSALSGETVTGFITVKDAAGVERKLAVVS